ncbi:Hypothetical predicted protein [Mytilus galloprovincialis]|uniref:DDE Tnp4 domain-containing protein n=1 Tax=Mytilus galloprovincialis TaxID=29158 RepID=A0A8B6CLU6_MYTGA|nr:Hypothetical predicted protein [Mytilus galloprovincialis]
MVKDSITKCSTNMRTCITAEERLSLTLKYLATGESYRSLSYSFRIAPSTVCSIIPEVCDSLYQALKDTYMKVPSTPEEWEEIATDFYEKWNYPNCLGAIDGKHIVVQAPSNSGSYYYNYKHTHSIVLMALVDANYRFTYVDVGSNGRVSDGGVFRQCTLQESIENELINFRGPKELPGRDKKVPFVVVGDEAFPLKEYLMKPYPQRAPILSSPDKVEKIVLCCCALHNYLRPEIQTANDAENGQDIGTGLLKVPRGGSRNSCQARQIRDEFKEYFVTTGQVPWQANVVR